jgi:hypothetical protein
MCSSKHLLFNSLNAALSASVDTYFPLKITLRLITGGRKVINLASYMAVLTK